MSIMQTFRALLRNRSGVAMTEFALGAPFLLTAGLWGVETANFAVVNMKVGQIAVHVADNGSRIGDTSTLMNRKLFEEDITDLLLGANIQGGNQLDLYQHGRVIVSSLEAWDDSVGCQGGGCSGGGGARNNGENFIRWQRCKGSLNKASEYGTEGDDMPSGIGPAGQEVQATIDGAVIFVEIYYDYQPLIALPWLNPAQIKTTSAFMVRDKRDMSKIYKRKAAAVTSSCNTFDTFAVAGS
jgi:hypothetical protein